MSSREEPPPPVKARAPFPKDIPFVDWLGAELISRGEQEVVIALDQRAHHANSRGMAHGGVLMTLLDVSMAMAARSQPIAGDDPGGSMITIEMKTTFMQPAFGRLEARARCVHRTPAIAFCRADVFDPEQKLVASGSGTFKFKRRRAPSPEIAS